MSSGTLRFHNQVCWARQYMVWEGLLSSAHRGIWTLTEKGRNTHLSLEDAQGLFRKWCAIHAEQRNTKKRGKIDEGGDAITIVEDDDAEEDSEDGQLLAKLRSMTHNGFERFCKYLLRVYGFERVEVTPVGKDGGIDGYGVLQLNPFVSFRVVFQCKKIASTVSRAQVGDLRNAMIGRADKGIMITTGIFSEDARREANRDGAPAIELIDGKQLIALLKKEEMGLKRKVVYEVEDEFFRAYLTD